MLDILLVEDNQDDVFLMQLASKECNVNWNFTIVNNGSSAVELLDDLTSKGKKMPDLILLDVNLPKVNGLEVLKNIKANTHTNQIPTVVFTSSDLMSDMKYCYEHGADLYVRKPNNISDFKKVIEYVMKSCFNCHSRASGNPEVTACFN